MNSNFKILTKKEVKQVKGGGWFSKLFISTYNRYNGGRREEANMQSNGNNNCPPPEPDRE